jgi:predicted transcriptional regulator of viral defense system
LCVKADRRDLRRRLVAIAGTQGGYFTAAQAKAAGYSYQAQAYHREAGNWEQIDRATYRLPEWPLGMHDDLIRWTLWSGFRAVVSYETALATHGIGEFEARRVHLTVPLGFRKDHDALVLHKANLPDQDIEGHEGYQITTVVRSLIDVASLAPDDDQLARAIGETLDQGRVTLRRLRVEAERISTRGALFIERAIPLVIERG